MWATGNHGNAEIETGIVTGMGVEMGMGTGMETEITKRWSYSEVLFKALTLLYTHLYAQMRCCPNNTLK